jgi:hypothetical protein
MSVLFTGCGLAETTAVAASEAVGCRRGQAGKELEAKVQRDIDAAQQAAADARAKAEAE